MSNMKIQQHLRISIPKSFLRKHLCEQTEAFGARHSRTEFVTQVRYSGKYINIGRTNNNLN